MYLLFLLIAYMPHLIFMSLLHFDIFRSPIRNLSQDCRDSLSHELQKFMSSDLLGNLSILL